MNEVYAGTYYALFHLGTLITCNKNANQGLDTFSVTVNRKYATWSLYMDLEPGVINEVRTGTYCSHLHPETLVTGKEDAANNDTCGHYIVSKELINEVMEKIRRLAGNCQGLQGFLAEYDTQAKLVFYVYPVSKLSMFAAEPCSSTTTHAKLARLGYCFMVDNEAIYGIDKNRLGLSSLSYTNLNGTIARAASRVAASLRFDKSLNEFQTNLVPFPLKYHLCNEKLVRSLLFCADVVSENVQPVVSTSKTKAGGDLAKADCSLCILSSKAAISAAWSRLDSRRALVH